MNLFPLEKLKRLLFYYSYIQDIGGSYNKNLILKRNLTGSQWVGKVSVSLLEKGVDFRDLNQRAFLAYRLAKLVKNKVLKPKIVPFWRISDISLADIPKKIDNNIFLTRFRGISLSRFLNEGGKLQDIKNINEIFDNFIFNLWIGNYDRKDSDYTVGDDKKVYFIDYHLWGPGFKKNADLSLGAYAEAYSITDSSDTGWCIGSPNLIQFIKVQKISFDKFLPMIQRIEKLQDSKIKQAINRFRFYDEKNEDEINDTFLGFLLRRRYLLRPAIKTWIEAGYPKGHRPKDLSKKDNLY